MKRVVRFYTVGLMGIGVQMGALSVLTHGLGAHHAIATALAVETAVLHNFLWHERWTWRCSSTGRWRRLCKFHVANGLLSMAANVVITSALVTAGMPVLAANAVAIAGAAALNYLACDLFVFDE